MLKIHSFLQGIKEPVHQLTGRLHKYKSRMATISYMMATVLFLISPDYLRDSKGSLMEYAKAETAPAVQGVEEETANEAIVLTNHIAISNMMTRVNVSLQENDSMIFNNRGTATDRIMMTGVSTATDGTTTGADKSSSGNNITETMADSNNSGADAKQLVDKEEKDQKTTQKETAEVKQKDTENVVHLTKDETQILQRIVEAEATGEDIKGKILVANVILNRVEDDSFPDTVEGVVFQKDGSTYQFSPIKDKRYWSVKVTQDTIKAVERVMQGEDYSQGALYFSARSRADKNSMSWFDSHLDFLFQYGGHEFFR